MKKAIALVWICLLCAGLLLYSILEAPALSAPDSTTRPSQSPSESLRPTEPPAQELRISLPSESGPWEVLAQNYLRDTGIALVSTHTDPTLVVADRSQLRGSSAYTDLTNTTANAMLYDRTMAYVLDGKVCGLPISMECYGLICNVQLLAANGLTVDQIKDLPSLTQAAQLIASQGTPAFVPMDTDQLASLLASMPVDPRAFLDLYIETTGERLSAPQIDSREEFLNDQAVFYLGNTADYRALSSMGEHQLGILPLYLGSENETNQTLSVVCREFICLNADASPEDQAMALDFLNWLIAPADGTTPIDLTSSAAPYRTASFAANSFERKLRQDMAAGGWCTVCQDLSKAPVGLSDALLAYLSFPTDENWEHVTRYLMVPEVTQ